MGVLHQSRSKEPMAAKSRGGVATAGRGAKLPENSAEFEPLHDVTQRPQFGGLAGELGVTSAGVPIQAKMRVGEANDRYEQEAIAQQNVAEVFPSAISSIKGEFQSLETKTQLSRKLPKELEYKADNADLARTWEETKVDVYGIGSALHSLGDSPSQTIRHAAKGFKQLIQYPSRHKIRKQAVVQNAIHAAWQAGVADYCERSAWITWNQATNTYGVSAVAVGTPYSCAFPPQPPDQVGHFHIHPPLDPHDPNMANPLRFPIGPSDTDERSAQGRNSPGIVRDFDSIRRTGGVTDYTYGPWVRM